MLPVLGKKAVLEWCMEEGLIGSSYVCPKCGKSMGKKERVRKQDAISNKIPLKIKIYRLKFKLEIVEALSTSPPTDKSILTDDEANSLVIPLAKRSKRYNPPDIHVMAFNLTIPG
ncbi:uncharacterized protein TNCV_3257981 [Trichonephila clavipes]|nr:uncharacterized protein TNCV_3257981 [Trichonephila clavipes]